MAGEPDSKVEAPDQFRNVNLIEAWTKGLGIALETHPRMKKLDKKLGEQLEEQIRVFRANIAAEEKKPLR